MRLWWTLRLPGVPILLAKKDVVGAFKWVWIDADDVPLFGADIPGDGFGLPGRRITAIYLCLTFGFTGSPGQWMGGIKIPGSRHAGASSQGIPETAAEDYVPGTHPDQ
jgi:hypothetical protein